MKEVDEAAESRSITDDRVDRVFNHAKSVSYERETTKLRTCK